MYLEVVEIEPRKEDDPNYPDYWLHLRHVNYKSVHHAYIEWEVPLTKSELESIKDKLPKKIQQKLTQQ